jgi:predicted nucleic acid-binding Zn ribbon protein
MARAKKSKEDWMGFYNGKIPKKATKKKTVKKSKPDVHECFYCSNKSNEGDGAFVDDLVSSEPNKKFWVCAPCISKHVVPSSVVAPTTIDDDDDDSIETLTPWEIMQMEKRQKDKNFWLVIFGVIAIAIILSLVERSRIFSVIAVVALVFVFLLYKYEVRN